MTLTKCFSRILHNYWNTAQKCLYTHYPRGNTCKHNKKVWFSASVLCSYRFQDMSGLRHVPNKATETQEIPSGEGVSSGKKRRRKKKVKRDPNCPKRPATACMFCSLDKYMYTFRHQRVHNCVDQLFDKISCPFFRHLRVLCRLPVLRRWTQEVIKAGEERPKRRLKTKSPKVLQDTFFEVCNVLLL